MSAQTPSRHVLKATAAVAAAGAVAMAPWQPLGLQALAQEAASAAAEPLAIRIGQTEAFTRIEFAGVVGARSRIRRDGEAVVVRLATTAAPDVSRLKLDPPPAVSDVQTRAVQGGSELVLTLHPGADFRSGVADGAVWLNLFAPGQAPAPDRSAAVPEGGVVPVRIEASETRLQLDFQFAGPAPAAVFRRGEAIWIVFDAKARLDLARGADMGPARDLRWAQGEDFTVVRMTAPEEVSVNAESAGSVWRVILGGPQLPPSGVPLRRDDEQGQPGLVAQMPGASRAIWLTDPLVGDRFAVVPALGPIKGVGEARRTVDLKVLPSVQGLVVESSIDDLAVASQGDLVRIGRPGGLRLSPPSAALEAAALAPGAPRKADHSALILRDWSDLGHAGFLARHRELQSAAAEEAAQAGDNPRAPIEARLALARFLVGSGLNFEAIGVLNALAEAPGMGGEPELRGLRGAARAAIGRLDEASVDFAAGVLAGDPSARVWRGYIAAQKGEWDVARAEFAGGAAVIDDFPPEWRARFATAHALAAVETNDLNGARELLNYAFAQDAPAADQLAARLVQARTFELTQQTDRALRLYKAVARAPLDGISTPAKLAVARLELARGEIDAAEAAARLEPLKWRWRGDATELSVVRTLGSLYVDQGRYREALEVLSGAGSRLPNLAESAAVHQDLADIFRSLYLDGVADGMQPVQALGLFYDFRDLTPVGADGDAMVRRLARRLVDVDLLVPAAELLKHQVDERLDGVAKAQVATDLANIYLMNREAEKALQAIWSSRTTLLPTALNAERRAVEARALMELGRYDHALELLETDRSFAADEVRAEVLWKQQKYGEAAAVYDRLLGDRWREDGALSPADESRLIRAGVGYSLTSAAPELRRLSSNYARFVEGARAAPALRIALSLGVPDATPGDFAAVAGRADTFAGWVQSVKEDLRERTGGASTPQTQTGAGAPAPTPAVSAPAAA